MKVTTDKATQKNATLVRLQKGSTSKFVEKQNTQELHIGYGDKQEQTRRQFVRLCRKVVTTAKQHRLKQLALSWNELRASVPKKITDAEIAEVATTAFVMANYEHTFYKQKPKDGFAAVEHVSLVDAPKEAAVGLKRGLTIGEEVNACRELANTPGADMTPKTLATAAKKAVVGTKVKIKVLGRKEMEKLGMGAVLGVGRGSTEEPQFIIAEYWGAEKASRPLRRSSGKKNRPIVFVGKGVTFDTGGLNIKTGEHMYEMHMDMSGGAAVIHAVALAARLGVKANIVALVPAVENSPSGEAMHPGDMLKSLSGKTIEILNTDAEGRVILADGITYAKCYNPQLVVDVATLTGAALVAVGTQCSAFMTNTMEMVPELMDLGEQSGDYLWPFPLWEEYDPMVKGTFGDVPNISAMGNSREGGVIAGGKFLEVFAKELGCPWVHIDMAPRMTSVQGDNLAKGAAGEPVRLLLKIAEHYAHKR